MPFDLPTSDQISALIGTPGITQMRQSQALQQSYQQQDRATAAYNALRNIYGPVVGNLDYLQMQQAAVQQAAANRTNTLLPGEVQAQQDTHNAAQQTYNFNTQANPLKIQGAQADVRTKQAGASTAESVAAENTFQTQNLAQQRGVAMAIKAWQNGGDPGAIFETPEAVTLYGPEKAKAAAVAARAHPELLPNMLSDLQTQAAQRPALVGRGAASGQAHVTRVVTDAQGNMYSVMSNGAAVPVTPQQGQQLATQLGIPITPMAAAGQPQAAPGQLQATPGQPAAPMRSGTFEQKTPQYQGQVERQKAYNEQVGKAEGGKVAADIAPSETEVATEKNKASGSFAQVDAHLRALDMARDQAGAAGIWSVSSFVPGTPAANMAASLKTAAGDMLMTQIASMKNEKGQTGVGRIMQAEIPLFANALANLEKSQSPAQLRANIDYARQVIANAREHLATYYSERYGFEVPGDMSAKGATITRRTPAASDAAYLRAHPDAREKFDAHFGVGAARRVLGQ